MRICRYTLPDVPASQPRLGVSCLLVGGAFLKTGDQDRIVKLMDLHRHFVFSLLHFVPQQRRFLAQHNPPVALDGQNAVYGSPGKFQLHETLLCGCPLSCFAPAASAPKILRHQPIACHAA